MQVADLVLSPSPYGDRLPGRPASSTTTVGYRIMLTTDQWRRIYPLFRLYAPSFIITAVHTSSSLNLKGCSLTTGHNYSPDKSGNHLRKPKLSSAENESLFQHAFWVIDAGHRDMGPGRTHAVPSPRPWSLSVTYRLQMMAFFRSSRSGGYSR
ncbi:hypothetical protein CERSUDRAFT_119591 [Gelatoporia subvermispora B]|uniref:Uncharacterized protein n=1 Tax=Ceriporiopsis subvermispora (strain B) TaxID=914234 RepID=M2P8K6_CERS8|nr:hypothetical protein CERSUDRAFT_119591 [Gelatoporia subvermispora B]